MSHELMTLALEQSRQLGELDFKLAASQSEAALYLRRLTPAIPEGWRVVAARRGGVMLAYTTCVVEGDDGEENCVVCDGWMAFANGLDITDLLDDMPQWVDDSITADIKADTIELRTTSAESRADADEISALVN